LIQELVDKEHALTGGAQCAK